MMKARLAFFLKLFFGLMAIFALEKLVFMIYNADSGHFGFVDLVQVLFHGFKLDSTVAGYFVIVPYILILISFWIKQVMIKKILIPYYILVAIVMSVLFVTDMCLYEFWGFKIDAAIFNYLDSPKNAMASVSVGYVVLRLILILGLVYGFYKLLTWITPEKFENIESNGIAKVCFSFIWILILLPLFVIIRGGISESTSNVGRGYYSNNQFFNHSTVNPIFSFLSSLGKHKKFSDQFNFYDENQRQQVFSTLYPQKNFQVTDTLLNTTRPNILMIVLESFGSRVVERLGGVSGADKNIEKLCDEGIYFSNAFANSFRTDRGLVAILSGYLGQPTTSIMKIAEKCGHLPSLARSLKEQQYHTAFFYGGDINFTNMNGYLLSTGYDKIFSDADFSNEQKGSKWGAHDEFTCERVLNTIDTSKSRFFYTYLTLSSHEPFDVPFKVLDNKVANSFCYTDSCVGGLIENLKKREVWKNLLIIITPDHNIRSAELPNHLDVSNPDFYKMPLILCGGAIKEGGVVVDKIVNQTDIPATILSQMGINYDDFPFSRNVFAPNYNYPFAFSAYNNGMIFRDSTGVTVYDNNANQVITNTTNDTIGESNAKTILQTLYDDMDER